MGKRSLVYHSFVSANDEFALTSLNKKGYRRRRSAGHEIPDIAENIGVDSNRGTNIMHITLDRTKRRSGQSNDLFDDRGEPREFNADEDEEGLVSLVGALVGLLLTVLIVITVTLVLKSRQKYGKTGWKKEVQEVVKGSISTEPMLVVRMQDCHNSSEV